MDFPCHGAECTQCCRRCSDCIEGCMTKLRPEGNVEGVLGVIASHRGELSLTLFSRQGNRIAVVLGSESYLLRALGAVGLASPVTSLTKNRYRRFTLLSRKPANGHT